MTSRSPEGTSSTADEPTPMMRVGAYALVVADARVLLTLMSERTPVPGTWGLPGGGLDHGEAPIDGVLREVYEETGHRLRDVRLADVGSHRFVARSPAGRLEDYHSVQVIYRAGVEQVFEPVVLDVGGSTAAAAWQRLDELTALALGPGTRHWLGKLLG